jgi:uncharacterized protein YegJ (DUF2314 family)
VLCFAACTEKRALPLPFNERASIEVAFIPSEAALDENAVRTAFAKLTATVRTEERAKYPGLGTEDLKYSAAMLPQHDLALVVKAKKVIVAEVSWRRQESRTLSATYETIAGFADTNKAFVFDRHTAAAFNAEAWRTRRLNKGWKTADHTAALADGPFHYNVHLVPQDDGLVMLDTGGLARFGLRDLTLLNVNRASVSNAGALVNLIAERLIAGDKLDDKGRLHLERKGKLAVRFNKAEPNTNARAEAAVIGFADLDCSAPGECLDQAITTVFGATDSVQNVKHDEVVQAASKRALSALEGFRLKVKHGIPPDETLLIKARFAYPNGNEWMWVDVHAWDRNTLKGTLENDPQYVTLKAGASVEVKLEDVMDYMYRLKDGSFYGNEVGRVVAPQMFEDAGGGRVRVKQQNQPTSP